MSVFASKFDVQSVETPLAVAAVAQVLDVAVGAVSGLYTGAGSVNDFSGGTPLTGAVSISPGTIVSMNSSGQAAPANAPVLWVTATGNSEVANSFVRKASGAGTLALKVLPFVVIDGNTDFSGKFSRRVTALHGGMTILTDQYTLDTNYGLGGASNGANGDFAPGLPVSFLGGKIVPAVLGAALRQIIGFVGPAGLDTVNGVLQVVIPQGSGL